MSSLSSTLELQRHAADSLTPRLIATMATWTLSALLIGGAAAFVPLPKTPLPAARAPAFSTPTIRCAAGYSVFGRGTCVSDAGVPRAARRSGEAFAMADAVAEPAATDEYEFEAEVSKVIDITLEKTRAGPSPSSLFP